MKRTLELLRYAVTSLTRARLRSLLTGAGVAIASGALISMVGFVLGLKAEVEAPLERLGLLNNIEVRPPDPKSDQMAASATLALDDAAIARIESLSHVDYAYPDFRLSEVVIERDEQRQTSCFAMGLPREMSILGYLSEFLAAGHFFSLDEQPQALLGADNLERLGWTSPEAAIGQPLKVVVQGLAPSGSDQFQFQRRELTVTIVGVIKLPSFAGPMGGNVVVLPVDQMRNLPGTAMDQQLQQLRQGRDAPRHGYARVTVRASRPARVAEVERQIRQWGFETRALVTEIEEAQKFFLFMQLLLGAVGSVALIVAGLGIFNTLLMTVTERYREIGLYKAMGASNGDVRLMFLAEAGLLGFFGGIGGIVLAWCVSGIVQRVFNEFARQQDFHGPMAAFRFPPWLLASAVAYAVIVSVLSGLYPAGRAARVDPIRALRGE